MMFADEHLDDRDLDIEMARFAGLSKPKQQLWFTPHKDIWQALNLLLPYKPYRITHSPSESHYGDYTPEHWTVEIFDEDIEMTSEVSMCHAICHAILAVEAKAP